MKRLLLVLFSAFLCADAIAGARADAPSAPSGTVAVYGDSLADGVWSGLYEYLKSSPQTHLVRHSQLGSGLTRPDYANWRTETARQIEEAGDGGFAVVMFGANDMQGVRDENRRGYLFKSPGWTNVYTQRIDWLLQTLKDHHVTTLWLGLPVMRKPETNEDAKYMTGLYETEAKKYGAIFLPTYQDYLDPDGNFMLRIDDSRQKSQALRSDDGIHFTGYGYQLLASKVLTRIARQADASPTPVPIKPVAAPMAGPIAAPAQPSMTPIAAPLTIGPRIGPLAPPLAAPPLTVPMPAPVLTLRKQS
ncbi:MAG: DUF459 domain-containing protein [Azospirillaceae bacterium]|nr:DUF459 domain-containing protein [Azospirillaceae bacterium]